MFVGSSIFVSVSGDLATTENPQRNIPSCAQDRIDPLRPLLGSKDKGVDAVEQGASAAQQGEYMYARSPVIIGAP